MNLVKQYGIKFSSTIHILYAKSVKVSYSQSYFFKKSLVV